MDIDLLHITQVTLISNDYYPVWNPTVVCTMQGKRLGQCETSRELLVLYVSELPLLPGPGSGCDCRSTRTLTGRNRQ